VDLNGQFEMGGDGAVARIAVGGPGLVVIAGPCVIESAERTLRIAEGLKEICSRLGLPLVFKASFDKANRTSVRAFRGPGMEEGLAVLTHIRRELNLCLTTDIHEPSQAEQVAQVVDLLQIPAFLCRQTDLLTAAGRTGRPVNIKKGQFQAPWDMASAVQKVRSAGAGGVMLTERGTSFGYNNLVVDLRSLAHMATLGVPVCFDATHSTQLPGANGEGSGGDRRMSPVLARGAAGAGIQALFIEVHDSPDEALSDASTQLPLTGVEALLETVAAIHRISRTCPPVA
jgi:2-dehydro-3-deoxyphosphooctonate aldolase (KDO 8-P synthase)